MQFHFDTIFTKTATEH